MISSISQTINQIQATLPLNVQLIAITKQIGIEPMREAYKAGVRNFGENRLQEALNKQEQLKDLTDISWHFIGHIQQNKAKKILENFDWIHSVDSLALAKRLNRLAQELNLTPKVFLQVKVLPDPQKYGWEVTQLWTDLSELAQYHQLKIQGLMTILPLGLSSEETLAAFQSTQKLSTQIKQENYSGLMMEELSMGMSGDYLLAIEAGATMIRIGTTIFGARNKQ
jgi:PLP dependent protein